MKPDPENPGASKQPAMNSASRAGAGNDVKSIDRVIRWCIICFLVSSAGLAVLAWHAVKVDRVGAYLNVAGIIYTILSTLFLVVIAMVFFQGHAGSSREIEAPKLELFELEKRR